MGDTESLGSLIPLRITEVFPVFCIHQAFFNQFIFLRRQLLYMEVVNNVIKYSIA